jgi:phosphodiesterase/alkaline phosphatase D-like protein
MLQLHPDRLAHRVEGQGWDGYGAGRTRVLQVVNGAQLEHTLEVEGAGLERTVPIASRA